MTIKNILFSTLAALTLASFGGSAQAGMPCRNGLSAMNGMPCRNGLSAMNGMPCRNGLSAMNGMPCRNGLSANNDLVSEPSAWVLSGIDPSRPLSQSIRRK